MIESFNELPYSNLHDNEYVDEIIRAPLNSLSNRDKIEKIKDLSFNPFSSNGRGSEYLRLTPDIDPDDNYFNRIIQYVDNCDYYDENSFQKLIKSSYNSNFSILHLNIRSIANKYDDFVNYLASLNHEFSIIGLTETWLTKDNLNNFPIPHYKYIGQVRNTRQGGGVGLYINKLYEFTERNDLSTNIENIIEAQFIEINSQPNNIIIGVIYRPPNGKYKQFEEKLSDILQLINQENKTCFLMGDFNIDLLKFNMNEYTNDFINQMFSSSFYPLITKPRRITKTTATMIDNIFVNKLEGNFKTGILLTDLSDHLPVFQLNVSMIPNKKTISRKKKIPEN